MKSIGLKRLSLLNTLLGRKYSIYKEIQRNEPWVLYAAVSQDDHKEYAVKFYDFSSIPEAKEVEMVRAGVLKEAALLRSLPSVNFVKILDIYDSQKHLAVVMELLSGKTLYQRIRERDLSCEDAKDIMKQLILSAAELHKIGVCLRSLRTEDVHIKYGVCKIACLDLRDSVGTDIRVAPEIRDGRFEGRTYSSLQQADIWTLAMCYLHMRVQDPSLLNAISTFEDEKTLYTKMVEDKLSSKELTYDQNKLLLRSLMKNPTDRMEWHEFTHHRAINCMNVAVSRIYLADLEYTYFLEAMEIKTEDQVEEVPIGSLEVKDFSFVALSRSDIEIYIADVNKSEEKYHQKLEQMYFEARLCEYRLKNIILPIEDKRLLKLEKRKYVELMYLMTSRCFMSLSFILKELKEHNGSFERKIKSIYKCATQKFNYYCSQLTSKENELMSKAADFFTMRIDKVSYQQKNKYFEGIQRLDFSTQEQINLTAKIIQKQKVCEHVQKIDQSVCWHLKIYKQLCEMKYQPHNKNIEKRAYHIYHNSQKSLW